MTEKGGVEEQSSRRRLADDAVLAAVALAIVIGIGFAAEVDVHTPTLLVAAGGAMVLELLLSLRPSRVRAVWERRYVRPLAVTTVVFVAIAGVFVAPSLVFALLWGGLGGYLLLAGTLLLLSGPPFGKLVARLRATENDEK